MSRTSPKVDGFLRKAKKWRKELTKLRTIILDCSLTEDVKWRVPCYTFENHNVVLINGFKDFCALNFVKGALLKDAKGILDKIGEHTQAGRWIKFTDVQQIAELEPSLKAYIQEAIEAEKAGLKVTLKKTSDFKIPEEFQAKLDEQARLTKAFAGLTPGRQRGYILYFSGAKQSKTRQARVEKCMERILDGKGLDD
ncbi:MAG TPA: DUF1801 domain-containing protein [Tepidisphaeraceae bacterium]|nr:DUF1801 domain-containing protein [Tepidisphaeraceae bacterium]